MQMAAKFFIRNGGWLISSTTRLHSTKNIKHFPNLRNSVSITRPLMTASYVDYDKKLNRLVFKWKDDLTDEYPVVWLRDNCQCPACFDQSSQSRNTSFSRFQLNAKPEFSVIDKDNVKVHWEDGHKSAYDLKWLKSRSFRQNEQQKWIDSQKAPYKTWTASDFKSIPAFDFQMVMKDDVALLEWLQTLDVWGVSRLENVPNSLGQAGNLANRVGFIKKTHYGEAYDIIPKPNANNRAYTAGYFQLHTDLPYYEYLPGINLLHCYIQYSGVGGDSILTDGFQIAEWLQENDPDTYKCLAETKITWGDVGQENGNYFHKINHAPVIIETRNKKIGRIMYNHSARDSHMVVPIDQAENWYHAADKFYGLAIDPRNLVEFKLEPGQLISFDNRRLLHGRNAFGDTIKGERHLQGAFVDWDEALSRIRVLKTKL